MRSEIEEKYLDCSSKVERLFADVKLKDDHTKSDRTGEIRKIVDQVLDELITKAVDACNQEVGAGDVDHYRKRINSQKSTENTQHRKRVEDWVNSQNEFHQLYQNIKAKDLSCNYKITRSTNDNNEPCIMWELNYPRYAMVKVVKIGSKDKIIHSNGTLDNAEVKRIVEASDKILNKKKGIFSRLRKALRKMCCCAVPKND